MALPSSLTLYTQRFLADPQGFLGQLDCPMLVWTLRPRPGSTDELNTRTRSNSWDERPLEGEPKVFELRKSLERPNPFAMGVTVGRTANNDIVLPHQSVSRFHAYFQLDPKSAAWSLVDAESKNGSWMGEVKLSPGRPTPLPEQARLRFGEVEVQFLSPPAFQRYVEGSLGQRN